MLTGDKGEFMKSLPIVITVSLLAASVVSFTFTPLISYYVLRGQKGFDEGGDVRSFFLFRYVDKGTRRGVAALQRRVGRLAQASVAVLGIGYACWRRVCCSFHSRQPILPAGRTQSVAWWTLMSRPPIR
jgi:multidrug efflux pump subunit AcrB